LHSFLPPQSPHPLSLAVQLVDLDLLLKNFHLSYLISKHLIALAHAPLAALTLFRHVNYLNSVLALGLAGLLLIHFHLERYLGNVSDFVSVGCFRTFAFSTFHLFDPSKEVVDGFGRDYLLLDEGFLEELYKFFVSQILLKTPCCKQPSRLWGLEDAANTLFIAIHEGDHGGEYASDVPAGTPSLLVVVREGGADGLADLEPSVVRQKSYLGWREGVILGEFEQAVIESLFILFFEIVEEEVEGEVAVALDQN
jgi:hypothetical protein